MRSLLEGKSVVLYAEDPAASTGGESLGLGDLMRVVSLLPLFRAKTIVWCSQPTLFPLVRDCPQIDQCFSSSELGHLIRSHDSLINLSNQYLSGVFEARTLMSGSRGLKQETFDLVSLIKRKLMIEGDEVYPVVAARPEYRFDVGLNLEVPQAWRIKALPALHWTRVEERLSAAGLTISRQPRTEDLNLYIDWIRDCRLLISVVGLGCHLAMYYGSRLLMLSGPTDFAEARRYPLGRVLRPSSACPHRPCNLPDGVDHCGCMPDLTPDEIIRSSLELLEHE